MNSKKKWQIEFINKAFAQKTKDSSFSDILLSDLSLVNSKNKYLPNSLFKFYTTTSENILDIQNKRLWLSHPSTFNDPFDCSIGYSEVEYEKKRLLEEIVRTNLIGVSGDDVITHDEYNQIYQSCVNGEEYYPYSKKKGYWDVMYNICKSKNMDLQNKIYTLRRTINDELRQKMDNIRKTNIRVACFIAAKTHDTYYTCPVNDECLSKIQMWSHYANNHKGFCVEYDISPIKKDVAFNLSWSHYYSNSDREKYLEERIAAVIKGGLFPVIYTSARIKIPYTKLKKYKCNESNGIVETLYKAYITKSIVWSYENEWRLIIDEKVSDYYKNKIPFPYIKKIYLGCKMDKKYIDEILSIAKHIGIEAQFMQMEHSKFDLSNFPTHYYELDQQVNHFSNPYNV